MLNIDSHDSSRHVVCMDISRQQTSCLTAATGGVTVKLCVLHVLRLVGCNWSPLAAA
jgi:hypothetical protein